MSKKHIFSSTKILFCIWQYLMRRNSPKKFKLIDVTCWLCYKDNLLLIDFVKHTMINDDDLNNYWVFTGDSRVNRILIWSKYTQKRNNIKWSVKVLSLTRNLSPSFLNDAKILIKINRNYLRHIPFKKIELHNGTWRILRYSNCTCGHSTLSYDFIAHHRTHTKNVKNSNLKLDIIDVSGTWTS